MTPYDPSDNYFKNFTKGRSGPKSNPLTNPNLRILGEDRLNQIKRMGPNILKEGAKKAAAGPAGPIGALTTGLAIGDALNTVTGLATGKDISERIADRVYEMSGMQAQEEAMGRPLVRPLDPATGYPVGYEAPTISAMTPEEFDIAKQNQVPAMQTEPQSTLGTDTAFMGAPTYGSTQGRPIDAISNVFRDPSFKENTSMTERGLGVGTENILNGIKNMAIDLLQESTGTNIFQDSRSDPSVSKERERELRRNPEEFQAGEFVPTADEGVTDINQLLGAKGREMPVIDETKREEKFDGSSEVKPSIDEDAPTPISPFDILRNQRGLSRAVRAGEQPTVDPASVLSPVSARTADGQIREGGLIGFTPQFEGQTLGQFLRYQDTPQQATFTGVDEQGRFRQFTPEGQLADSESAFEAQSQAREARMGQLPGVGGPESAFRDRDLDASGRFKPSIGDTGISLNEARRIVDPQGKMSTPARTAAAQEYIRQEEIKTQDRARKDIDRQNEERMNELRIEGQRLQNVIRQKQLDDPKFDENVYSRDLTQKVADIAEKFRENPSYEPSSDERKTIFEYDAYRVGKLGASGIAYSPFLDQFGANQNIEDTVVVGKEIFKVGQILKQGGKTFVVNADGTITESK